MTIGLVHGPTNASPSRPRTDQELDGTWTEHWDGLGYNERYTMVGIAGSQRIALECLTRNTYKFDDAVWDGAQFTLHKVNNPESDDPYIIDYTMTRSGPDELCGTVSTDHNYTGKVCWRRGEPEDDHPVEPDIE